MHDNHQSGDLEVVISGIVASRAGMTERQRLDVPMRLKMLVSQATHVGATYMAGDTPMMKDEFVIAVELAKLRQLDRIADLLEKLSTQLDDRKK
jgi:hypothetical protein